VQHGIGVAALVDDPRAWLMGFGAESSDLLRVLLEQGVIGLAVLATLFALQVRRSTDARQGDVVERAAALASLVAAGVLAAFDPQLVRPERIALLGVLLGAGLGSRSPSVATLPRAGLVSTLIVSAACILAQLRAASYAASSRIGVADGPAGLGVRGSRS
jgi:hypothetical protein